MSVASSELRKLNNYPEFKNAAGINAVMVYIQAERHNRPYPRDVNTNRKSNATMKNLTDVPDLLFRMPPYFIANPV